MAAEKVFGKMRISRGTFIGASLGASALLARPGLAQTPGHLVRLQTPLTPVRIDPNRVIRTVVGLRPFRPSGFMLKAQRLGEKLLVHDYGHGGGGFSLSWGCATLAADLISNRSPASAAVMGCGVIGLTAARVLQDRGWAVTIYASALPPQTTSNVAGAQWTPTSVFSRGEASAAFMDTFRNAARIANRAFQLMVGPTYGVRWVDNYVLKRTAADSDQLDYAESVGISDLYADIEEIDAASAPFTGVSSVRRFTSMLMEPNTFLPAVERDFLLRGGKFVVKQFRSVHEVAALKEAVVLNCTGLGSRQLFGDEALEPVRGQLTILEPQDGVDYDYLIGSLYMFPRNDGIVLGGTFDHGDWSTAVDLATQARILAAHEALFRKA
jgi:glycine/D-amino acid oxidase-like deaminating enzyme